MADKKYTSFEQAQAQEKARVDALIIRDRDYQTREDDRRRAEIEVGGGMFVNLSDTVVEPTPEWLEKGNVSTFRPKQPDGTVRVIKTVRRVSTPIVVKMFNQGRIDESLARACLWFRQMHEYSGLTGRWSTSNMSSVSGTSTSSKSISGFSGHIPMTESEYMARSYYRMATESIPAHLRKFFVAVVIGDLSLRRASKYARCRNDQAMDRFRIAASALASFCDSESVELSTLRPTD